ncbi:hypothetical protein ABZ894_13820 [Nocardia beijingensis]|uniref:hypothetical protein n=1 Tax=Nocardia beijingensis TaxID=95162 RepID=UPI0033C6586D
MRLDFAACASAAALFVQEWRACHYEDAAMVLPGDPTGLLRLPNEQLFLAP